MPEVNGGRVVFAGEARSIHGGGSERIVLADATDTQSSFSLIETREEAAGTGPPVHIHRDAAESFYVIEGQYRFHLDGRDFICAAGSFVYVPVGMAHTFSSMTPGTRKLNLYTPAAMVGSFDELAAGTKDGMDAQALHEIAERYAMEIVGPVPEGYVQALTRQPSTG